MDIRTKNKQIALEFNHGIRAAGKAGIAALVRKYCHEDLILHAPEPWNDIKGIDAIIEKFWLPFFEAFEDLEKQEYILLAGEYDPTKDTDCKPERYLGEFSGNDWVGLTGNYIGTQTKSWLGIPPCFGIKWIRYGEINRVVDGKIKEIFTIIDVLDVMRQAGYSFLEPTAPEILIPGPATFDGVIRKATSPEEDKKTLTLMEDMLYRGLLSFEGNIESKDSLKNMGMERFWHKDMMWYGPCGIGSTRAVKGFQAYHQGPYLTGFPDRVCAYDFSRFGEGNYCCDAGWPSINTTHTGMWQGKPGTGKKVWQRCMDFWRRDGNKLVENWVFLDIIDMLKQMGYDVFAKLEDRVRRNTKK